MNRKGQVFPIERRALLKHAGLAAAGFAVMPLAACEAPNKLLQGSTGGSNPLAIPPLQVGRISGRHWKCAAANGCASTSTIIWPKAPRSIGTGSNSPPLPMADRIN